MVSKFGAPDGLCVRADEVLRGLLEQEHEVHVFTHSKNVDLLPAEQVHRFRGFWANRHFSVDMVHTPKTIARECSCRGIEVLDVQMNSGTTEFLLPLFKSSLPPLVVTYHLAYSDAESLMRPVFSLLGRASVLACRRYDAIILVHPFQDRLFLQNDVSRDKLNVIVNGVDTDVFKPPEHRTRDSVVEFIYVGRLSLDKGVHITIQAFKKYHEENPQSRLTLIGDGMLKSMLHDHDCESIKWLGTVDHSLVHRHLQRADVFVVPMSIGPLTSSMSVLEAMSCGLPLITTDVAGARRILSPEEGLLVKPESVPEVVNAMRFMADNEETRLSMGRRCRERILREHSWKRQVGLIEDVYSRVIRH